MKRLFGISIVLLVTISLIVYYPALKGFFVSDDFILINSIHTHGPFGVWTFRAGFFRPIISLSIFADYLIWGLNPIGYKLTNILVHALNSTLVLLSVWLLTTRLVLDRQLSVIGSFVAGMIFALLPAHAEAVSWISGRTDVISTFWGLCSWCAFLIYGQNRKVVYLVASSVALALALLSKEGVITLPFVMGLYIIYLYAIKQEYKPLLRGFVVNTLVLFLYLPLRSVMVGGLGGYGANIHLNFDPVRWIAGPPIFLARTIWPCCWPSGTLPSTLAYSEQIGFMRWFYLAIGVAIVVILTGVAFAQIYRRKMSWGIVLFLLVAGITAQLPSVNIGLQAETRIGERLVYLPSVFISSLIAIIFTMTATKKYRLVGVGVAIACIYGVALWNANITWYQSGEIARNILDSMQKMNTSRAVLVILPDHLRGAFIFRNGIQSASDLLGIGGQWRTIALVTLDSTTDGFALEIVAGQYKLTPLQAKNVFIPLIPPENSITISSDNRSAQIAISNVPLAYYSQGQLQFAP